ncbi:hypothetical protein EYF80_004541 [Liparis tanakae]|uniref:Secreted protein n=1 Tax=Liparis tanakae TaxID=230148 RepID=A0A4Z2J5I8_9TELE|nr:hypothetical protein EYF80_004541 [Liparis tanakae]
MSRSSRVSLSSCACCLLSATCAAITRCLSAIRVHFAHTQSLQRQKRLWPFSADTTPWFLHLAHFGVRGYPLSRAGLQARRKRDGGRRREGGTCKPPRGLCADIGVILLSIAGEVANTESLSNNRLDGLCEQIRKTVVGGAGIQQVEEGYLRSRVDPIRLS